MAAPNPSHADHTRATLAAWYHSAGPYILSLATAPCSNHQHHHNSSASSSDEAEDEDHRQVHHLHHHRLHDQQLHHRLNESSAQTAVQTERLIAGDVNEVSVQQHHVSNTDQIGALAGGPTYLLAWFNPEKQADPQLQPPSSAMPVVATSAAVATNPAMDHHQAVTRPGPAASNPTRKPKAGFGMSGVSHSGNLSHSGAIMLNTGPIISHSGPLKGASAGKCHPSIIPAEILGKKKPAGFETEEPLSPEVTCLGRVKIKKKFYRTQKDEPLARYDLTETSLKEGPRKQRAPEGRKKKKAKKREAAPANPSLQGSRRLSKNYSTCGLSREAAAYTTGQVEQDYEEDLAIDLSRFGNATECVESSKQRGAILAKSLVNLLQQASMLEAGTPDNDQYVPQVPPSNSLLLMRGSRNLEHFHNQLHAASEYDNLNESISLFDLKKAAMAQRQVSLPHPPPEARLWQRRAIAKPSALDIKRPPAEKLEIKKPTTT